MIQLPAQDAQVRAESRTSVEEELDLFIGELEQHIPDRGNAAVGTCIRVYCLP
ncbi:hypothetical protein [Streptomyces graminilatus]|uniref:hypothetical protein n=1 Tax=Streptomyces graminilatus TaxID=1464070 RepID=UPI000AFCD99D|nr:hypothetical protein [Streptomyces graminilatus]